MTRRECLAGRFGDLLKSFTEGRLSYSEMAAQARAFASELSAGEEVPAGLPADHFHLHTAPGALSLLFAELKERGYIHRRTSFSGWSWICCGRGLPSSFAPVVWLGSARSLSWFVSQFFDSSDKQIWKKAACCFVMANGRHPDAGTLRRSVNKVLRSGAPYAMELDAIHARYLALCAGAGRPASPVLMRRSAR